MPKYEYPEHVYHKQQTADYADKTDGKVDF